MSQIEESIQKIKASREMGARYMTLQELLEDEREERDKEIILKLHKAGMEEKTMHEMLDFPLEKIRSIIGQKNS